MSKDFKGCFSSALLSGVTMGQEELAQSESSTFQENQYTCKVLSAVLHHSNETFKVGLV